MSQYRSVLFFKYGWQDWLLSGLWFVLPSPKHSLHVLIAPPFSVALFVLRYKVPPWTTSTSRVIRRRYRISSFLPWRGKCWHRYFNQLSAWPLPYSPAGPVMLTNNIQATNLLGLSRLKPTTQPLIGSARTNTLAFLTVLHQTSSPSFPYSYCSHSPFLVLCM